MLNYDFLCALANFLAASTLPNPQAFNANALRVGSPLGFFIAPIMPANQAAKETLRGLTPDLTGAFK